MSDWITSLVSQPSVSERLTASSQPDVDEARSRIVALRLRLDGLARAFASGAIDVAQLSASSARLREEQAAASRRLAAARRATRQQPRIGEPEVRARWAELTLLQRRRVVESLCEIAVRPQGKGRARAFDASGTVTMRLRSV